MQDEIARAIAAALQLKLSATSAAPRRYTPNVAAYEAYLKGLHYGRTTTLEAGARTREYLTQAVALDPGFALAHGELGWHSLAKHILTLPTTTKRARRQTDSGRSRDCAGPAARVAR